MIPLILKLYCKVSSSLMRNKLKSSTFPCNMHFHRILCWGRKLTCHCQWRLFSLNLVLKFSVAMPQGYSQQLRRTYRHSHAFRVGSSRRFYAGGFINSVQEKFWVVNWYCTLKRLSRGISGGESRLTFDLPFSLEEAWTRIWEGDSGYEMSTRDKYYGNQVEWT